MTRAMVDIETLGREPGCSIVSIGAVRFSLEDGIGDEMFVSVDIESCENHGLDIEAATLQWWLKQDHDAREQLLGGEDLEDALRQLSGFVRDCDEIWANSPRFDCGILRTAYDAVGWTVPWSFWAERDYRTARDELADWPDREQDGTDHDALDDARHQAECLVVAKGGEIDD